MEQMDPKLLAIMAKLDKKRKTPSPALESQTSPDKEKIIRAPKTLEEFMKVEKLDEWPERITSENLLDLDEERNLLGTQEEIMEELRKAVPYDIGMLDDLEGQLAKLEGKLNSYASQILTDEKRDSRQSNRLFYSPNKAFMTEISGSDAVRSHTSSKGQRKDMSDESKRKSVDNCSFPGFRSGELIQLPGQLEGPQLLHRVTKAQEFNPGFKKFWKKIFLSEASVALMQDSFWWFFIQNFEKNRKSDQDQMFDRIADSFVALFTSINPEVKDKFLAAYPDCLAQAIYAAFHELFPESERHFQDTFKQQIINTTAEWIAGVKPPPGTYTTWNVKKLESKSMRDTENSQVHNVRNMISAANLNKEVSMSLDLDDFNKKVHKLGDNATPGEVKPDTARAGTSNMQVALISMSGSKQVHSTTPRKKDIESHQIGPSHELERVMFNTKGQSPLVAHYLQMRQLQDHNKRGPHVRRTEVAKLQPEGKTYRELIKETQANSQALSQEYQRICDITSQEINRLEKQKRDMNRRMEKLKRELMFSKNSTEIRILSQQILERREEHTTLSKVGKRAKGDDRSSDENNSSDDN